MLVTAAWQRVVENLPRGALLRFRPEFARRVWTGPEDLRFATEVGVSYSKGLFCPFTSLIDRDPATPDIAFTPREDVPDPVATPHGRFQQLGELYGGDLYVDLGDGGIWISHPDRHDEGEYELINGDLSSLAYVLYKLEAESPTRDMEIPGVADWQAAMEVIREHTDNWDRIPFASKKGFWSEFMDSYIEYY